MARRSKRLWMTSALEKEIVMKTKHPVTIVALIGIIVVVGAHGCKEAKDYYNRGIARLEKGEHDGAILDFTKAIEKNPRFANAYFYRGRAYLGKGEFDQAISDLNKAIEIDPRLAVAYGERAVIYFIKKEYDKVWENIHKQESLGLEADPGFLKALREASGRKK